MSIYKYSKPIDLRNFNRDNQWRITIASKQKAIAEKLLGDVAEVATCPICDAITSSLFVEVYSYPFHECAECGHLYSKFPPTSEALASLYTEDKEGKVLSAQSEIYIQKDLYDKRVREIAKPKAEFASNYINRKGKWIDIGAGVGDLVVAANGLGWDAVGYESDEQEVQFAKTMGANVQNLFLTPNDMEMLKEATIVSTINVLEHVLNPKQLVKSISDNLSAGTYFLFEVPRFPSLSSLANRCFPDLAARNIYSPDHLHLFTDKSASIMMSEAGFLVEAIWFFGQDIYEVFGNVLAKGDFSNHVLVDMALSLTNQLQEVVDRNNLSDTMLVLAKKNG